jgi:hypothetical protein
VKLFLAALFALALAQNSFSTPGNQTVQGSVNISLNGAGLESSLFGGDVDHRRPGLFVSAAASAFLA